jgi:hypothetical protein
MPDTFNAKLEFKKNLDKLNILAQDEYKTSLDQIIIELPNSELARLRLARLLGVQFKEPFGSKHVISPDDSDTRALHAWYWDSGKFDQKRTDNLWQYQILETLCINEVGYKGNLSSFAAMMAGEGDISKYLLKSTRKYVCGNDNAKRNIEDVVNRAKIQRITNPNDLISMTGSVVSGIIIASAPAHLGAAFAAALAPVASVITIFILRIGLDKFCNWSEDYARRQFTRTT